jgi:hypothetical protein
MAELGDYKPVNGWYLPFAIAVGAKGSSAASKAQFAWERIEANVSLDDRLFSKPAAGLRPAKPRRRRLARQALPAAPHCRRPRLGGCGPRRLEPPRDSAHATSAPPPRAGA